MNLPMNKDSGYIYCYCYLFIYL